MPESPSPESPGKVRISTAGWFGGLVASALLAGVAALQGWPSGVIVGLGLLPALWSIGGVIVDLAVPRLSRLGRALRNVISDAALLDALDLMDRRSHGALQKAHQALARGQEWLASEAADADEVARLSEAQAVVDELEDEIRRTRPRREARRMTAGPRTFGRVAIAENEERTDDAMNRYGDPSTIPTRVGRVPLTPRVRDLLTRIGAPIDDVRALHDAEIEWSVLLFTMWMRTLLVGFAPLLASLSFTRVPLEGGNFDANDIPWVIATLCSIFTAVFAPKLATSVMSRQADGARLRRILLIVEVPIACAALLTAPCWMVATFAAGWTNWWQRPVFNWIKLAVWIAAVVGLQAAGTVFAGGAGWGMAPEAAITMAVIGIIGGSYGAMLPVSASMLVSVLVSGILSPRRGQHAASEHLRKSIHHLLDAAQILDARPQEAAGGRGRFEATNLRDVAATLARGLDATDRWARTSPRQMRALVGEALQQACPDIHGGVAEYEERLAMQAGAPLPVTSVQPTFADELLPMLKFRDQGQASALALIVIEIGREARGHGTGPLTTICSRVGDRIVLRFANAISSESEPGRGDGARALGDLVAKLSGGHIDLREEVDGTFVDLPPKARRFGVQVSFNASALTSPERIAA